MPIPFINEIEKDFFQCGNAEKIRWKALAFASILPVGRGWAMGVIN
jgi:hypothetical protein